MFEPGSPQLWWSLTLHDSNMTTLKYHKAPLAEHALPVQIQGIVVAKNLQVQCCVILLAKSLHFHHSPTIHSPFTHHLSTIHPRPMEPKWFLFCFNQGTFHHRCKMHRELIGFIWECVLGAAQRILVALSGCPCFSPN